MYGAILGDMIGAPYEFDRGNKTKDFTLFTGGSNFTDDTVMTIAVAEALLNAEGKGEAEVKAPYYRIHAEVGQEVSERRIWRTLHRLAVGSRP